MNEQTRVTNPKGVQRRVATRTPEAYVSLSAHDLARMTLKEILAALRLPARFAEGDADHEGTNEALDLAVLAGRFAVNRLACEHEAQTSMV